MSYVLEASAEFDRLERQAALPGYDFHRELALAGVSPRPGHAILDAGCGSGVVTRHLARSHPQCTVTGCDLGADRLASAARLARDIPNITFSHQDLARLDFPAESFDLVFCRYVLQHVSPEGRASAVAEFKRCLRPGGKACLVDFDGTLYNLHPQTPLLSHLLGRLEREFPVDLRIGRKLPAMLVDAGFSNVRWRIDTVECTGPRLEEEVGLTEERLTHALEPLAVFFGSRAVACQFRDEYLAALQVDGAVLFYNKFVVTGVNERPC
ncbi:MAG: class I SAM-dependent methyltransferase [Deltaproteobacteria bacterium]|nr:class I SAM-dependent methyltransferase [Deltaproteobacteria bacterium]